MSIHKDFQSSVEKWKWTIINLAPGSPKMRELAISAHMTVCQAWLWYEHSKDKEVTESMAAQWKDEVHIAVGMKMSPKELGF